MKLMSILIVSHGKVILKYYIAAFYTGICVGESPQDCVVKHVVYGDR